MNDLLSILPNLSIGVVSICGLIIVVRWFIAALKEMRIENQKSMNEREAALRGVEADVRKILTNHLAQATSIIQENTKILERVAIRLDRH